MPPSTSLSKQNFSQSSLRNSIISKGPKVVSTIANKRNKIVDESATAVSGPSHPEAIEHTLEVDALFWDRDSHGLFDYESKYLS